MALRRIWDPSTSLRLPLPPILNAPESSQTLSGSLAILMLPLYGGAGRLPLPERWSTGPGTRFEVEKTWGVRTGPYKG